MMRAMHRSGAYHAGMRLLALLACMLLLEGVFIIVFAQAGSATMAVVCMITFAMFLKMANGATYAIWASPTLIPTQNWQIVEGTDRTGTGGPVQLDCPPPAENTLYYRVGYTP